MLSRTTKVFHIIAISANRIAAAMGNYCYFVLLANIGIRNKKPNSFVLRMFIIFQQSVVNNSHEQMYILHSPAKNMFLAIHSRLFVSILAIASGSKWDNLRENLPRSFSRCNFKLNKNCILIYYNIDLTFNIKINRHTIHMSLCDFHIMHRRTAKI